MRTNYEAASLQKMTSGLEGKTQGRKYGTLCTIIALSTRSHDTLKTMKLSSVFQVTCLNVGAKESAEGNIPRRSYRD